MKSFETYMKNKNLLNIAYKKVKEFFDREPDEIKLIGSSSLSPEEQKKQDQEKYGKNNKNRDIDILIIINGLSNEDEEKWAFSKQAQQLEDEYNLDVQVKGKKK